MAKKARTPKPPKGPQPRRVQAPQRRVEPRRPAGSDRRRLYLLGGGGVALVAVIVGIVLATLGGGGSATPAAASIRKAGCAYTEVPAVAQGRHMARPDQHVTYNSYPPTNGTHDPTPAIWGDYSQAVDPRQAVHNEEHGGMIIWYGPKISSQARQQITSFYSESPDGILITPLMNTATGVTYPPHAPLGARIALTAWHAPPYSQTGASTPGNGVIATCPHLSEKAFRAFRGAFRGKGPERFPVSSLAPGS